MYSCRSEEVPLLGLCYREDEVPGSIKGGTSYIAEKLLCLKKDCSPCRLVKDCQTAWHETVKKKHIVTQRFVVNWCSVSTGPSLEYWTIVPSYQNFCRSLSTTTIDNVLKFVLSRLFLALTMLFMTTLISLIHACKWKKNQITNHTGVQTFPFRLMQRLPPIFIVKNCKSATTRDEFLPKSKPLSLPRSCFGNV
jgi:hypothetical protein